MPKLQEIFTTVAIVCHRYERLDVWQNVFAIILLWARKGVERLFEETVYKSIKTKKEAKMKFSVWDLKMPKLAQIVEQSSGARHVYISVFFFSDHCIKQIDSMLPWVCSVIDHRGRQNVVKTSVTNSPAARVSLLFFNHILTSSVIYYWTGARQHGIFLLIFTRRRAGPFCVQNNKTAVISV